MDELHLWLYWPKHRRFNLYTNKDVMFKDGRDQDVPNFVLMFMDSLKLFLPEKIMIIGRFEGLHEDDGGQWKNSFGSVMCSSYISYSTYGHFY